MRTGQATTVRARSRLSIAAVVGIAVGTLTAAATATPAVVAALDGWDAAAASFLIWVWATIWTAAPGETKALATREDPGRALADILLVAASVACLAGVGITLVRASAEQGTTKTVLTVIAVVSVVLSWAVVHTVFTLRYARLYYDCVSPSLPTSCEGSRPALGEPTNTGLPTPSREPQW